MSKELDAAARVVSDVWVVRNRHGDIVQTYHDEPHGQREGLTVTRETLLTPAHAAVIALVKRLYEHHVCIKGMGNEARLNCWDDLMEAAATLFTTPTEDTP